MNSFKLLAFIALLPLTACGKETFDSTCLGFSKSHWSAYTNEQTTHKDLCTCVKTELTGANVSPEGMETLRQAMSASIVARNRFESELNKAVENKSLSETERTSYGLFPQQGPACPDQNLSADQQ